ncbi:hypothetical protein BB560_003559 [Smittium megazygosporum]|uniref:ACT domain-containing protein n=1 Tax=Smittium megazygosporum TaxID=133381 RepID=A0A2T9ZBP3_9FUNG|nr:hypothetical protein BB560_003559 [Smittium megazygosporum]
MAFSSSMTLTLTRKFPSLVLKSCPRQFFAARYSSSTQNQDVSSSSTSSFNYKTSGSQKIKPIPGVIDQATAKQFVSELMELTPLAPRKTKDQYIIDCLAQDEPGVLSSVTGIMAARGFSIDTLVASKTEVPGLSRMTIGLKGSKTQMEQAKKQLEDLVPVWAVLDFSQTQIVNREALLVKLDLNTSSSEKLTAIKNVASLFNANVCDIGPNSIVAQLFAKSSKIDAFLKLVRPFGILEAVRSGTMVMSRSHQGNRVYGSSE